MGRTCCEIPDQLLEEADQKRTRTGVGVVGPEPKTAALLRFDNNVKRRVDHHKGVEGDHVRLSGTDRLVLLK